MLLFVLPLLTHIKISPPVQALEKGQANKFYPEKETKDGEKGDDIIIPVLHKFMQKHLIEDENEVRLKEDLKRTQDSTASLMQRVVSWL